MGVIASKVRVKNIAPLFLGHGREYLQRDSFFLVWRFLRSEHGSLSNGASYFKVLSQDSIKYVISSYKDTNTDS